MSSTERDAGQPAGRPLAHACGTADARPARFRHRFARPAQCPVCAALGQISRSR